MHKTKRWCHVDPLPLLRLLDWRGKPSAEQKQWNDSKVAYSMVSGSMEQTNNYRIDWSANHTTLGQSMVESLIANSATKTERIQLGQGY